MLSSEARYQSFAVAGAVLIVYIGICHEFVGAIVFPFGPALFGGAVGWHAFGLGVILTGVLLLAGVLDLARLPVTLMSLFCVLVGVALAAYVATVHGRFHLFAVSAVLAAVTVAVCYRSAQTYGHG